MRRALEPEHHGRLLELVGALMHRCGLWKDPQNFAQEIEITPWPVVPGTFTTSILNWSFKPADIWREPTMSKVLPLARSIAFGTFREDFRGLHCAMPSCLSLSSKLSHLVWYL